MARLERSSRLDHRSILKVLGGGVADGYGYVVSEHVEGTDLAALIARPNTSPPSAVTGAHVIREVFHALAHAHAIGLAHPALSAKAIRIDARGRVLLSGFLPASLSDTSVP